MIGPDDYRTPRPEIERKPTAPANGRASRRGSSEFLPESPSRLFPEDTRSVRKEEVPALTTNWLSPAVSHSAQLAEVEHMARPAPRTLKMIPSQKSNKNVSCASPFSIFRIRMHCGGHKGVLQTRSILNRRSCLTRSLNLPRLAASLALQDFLRF